LLNKLEHLTHLDLEYSWQLDLGFNGGPDCGNAYDGKDGNEYLREVTREGAEATEKGGDLVVAYLPYLTSFTIGGATPNITRTEGIMVNASWPWTGRMDEWLMEEVPDLSDFEDEVKYGSM
jgi:hypothetical protein